MPALPSSALASEMLKVDAATCAEHVALLPPLTPLQVQLHGPPPTTAPAAPTLHRLTGGALNALPLSLPQAPLSVALVVKSACTAQSDAPGKMVSCAVLPFWVRTPPPQAKTPTMPSRL